MKNEKVLILEDNDDRIKIFKRLFLNADIVKTAKEAIDLVAKNKYDIIFLDHDLGGEVYVDSEHENTGYQVAKFIMYEDNPNKITEVIVHSMNWWGANNIKTVIRHAKLIPFGNLMKSFVSS